ncbi:MAG: hypothetical protein IH906_01260 [Proteobacteria bacterium]|nr:hypothetical protein [Pseudomonadota bacterium]
MPESADQAPVLVLVEDELDGDAPDQRAHDPGADRADSFDIELDFGAAGLANRVSRLAARVAGIGVHADIRQGAAGSRNNAVHFPSFVL